MNTEKIAKICHEINRVYCLSLGDNSQASWADAPQWQKDSAIAGVKLHKSGDYGPEVSHESWMQQKINDGWVYGENKNSEAKTHPCIVAFEDLPVEQQAKDFIFAAVVKQLSGTI